MLPTTRRIVDASANRAREAARTLEDVARFALGDAALVERLKALRHAVTQRATALAGSPLALLAARDTASDVGAAATTGAESSRASLRDVVLAAGSRLTEALRTLEECAKVERSEHIAGAFKQLRYAAHDLGRDVALALGAARERCASWRLCVILTEALCARPWLETAKAALEGGADCLQLREKALPDRELLSRARALVELAHSQGQAAVVVNDRVDIALLAGADGVHLGRSDLPLAKARALAGEALVLGASVSSLEEARAAQRAGADCLGAGAMFPTTTKRKDAIAGPALLRELLAQEPPLPAVLAIGGVSPSTLPALLEAAGGRPFGVAVCSCVCAAADPAAVCAQLLDTLRALRPCGATRPIETRSDAACPTPSATPRSTTA